MSDQFLSVEMQAKAETFAGQEHVLLIEERWQPVAVGRTSATLNPATRAYLGAIAKAGEEDVERAVTAPKRTVETVWSKLPQPSVGACFGG